MKIAYFGLPIGALLLHEDGHSIELAVMSFERAPGTRRLERAIGAKRLLGPGAQSPRATAARVKQAEPDLVVSWFYTRKVPMEAVHGARLGGIGAHPSLLPRHRGPDPFFAAIDQADRETGVTVHKLEVEYDTGAILAQARIAIRPTWNAWQLAKALDRPSLRLLRDTVRAFAQGAPMIGQAQDEALASYAPAPSDDDAILRWSWPSAQIVRRIRALAPSPGAFTVVNGHELGVLEAEARGEGTGKLALALLVGEAAIVDGTALVRASDGLVALLAGTIDGAFAGRTAIANLVSQGAGVSG